MLSISFLVAHPYTPNFWLFHMTDSFSSVFSYCFQAQILHLVKCGVAKHSLATYKWWDDDSCGIYNMLMLPDHCKSNLIKSHSLCEAD